MQVVSSNILDNLAPGAPLSKLERILKLVNLQQFIAASIKYLFCGIDAMKDLLIRVGLLGLYQRIVYIVLSLLYKM
jgi:ABC-type multidrug transport system fused ATPase/permease subunit